MGVKKSDTHFNTTNEDGETVRKYAEKNVNQNNRVLEILKKAKKPMTASQVWEIYGMVATPLTSMRRALTTWKVAGIVEKTDKKREGLYGRSEYHYQIIRHGKRSRKQNKQK